MDYHPNICQIYSRNQTILIVWGIRIQPLKRTTTYGLRSFEYYGSHMWNMLPVYFKSCESISELKNRIKHWSGLKCSCSMCVALLWFDVYRTSSFMHMHMFYCLCEMAMLMSETSDHFGANVVLFLYVPTLNTVSLFSFLFLNTYFDTIMTTSSNGVIFRVTGPFYQEFTGHRWFPLTKASDAELWCFRWSAPWTYGWVNNREAGDLRRHRAHYDVIVMEGLKIF